jgi:hypothetical protein
MCTADNGLFSVKRKLEKEWVAVSRFKLPSYQIVVDKLIALTFLLLQLFKQPK